MIVSKVSSNAPKCARASRFALLMDMVVIDPESSISYIYQIVSIRELSRFWVGKNGSEKKIPNNLSKVRKTGLSNFEGWQVFHGETL